MAELFGNLIAGDWRQADRQIDNINPSDLSDLIGRYAQAGADDLNEAIEAAAKAQRAWQRTGLEARQNLLDAIGREMIARSAELGELLAREEGKPLAEGKGEVYRAGQFFTYYAAECLRQIGETADSVRPDIEIDVRCEPMGIVAVISPWNFPTATASWKIAPALAFGNAVIWKPANQTPASAWALAEIIQRQGAAHNMPAGLFSLVMGSGSTIGQALAEDSRIGAVTFTGSLDVGRRVAAAAAGNLTKFQLELGSKNALLVMDDADLDLAVAAAVAGGYSGTGQKCTASSRLLVHSAVHDAFAEKLKTSLEAMKVGHALEEGTQIGPVVSEGQLSGNLDYMKLAVAEGCEVATGGERVSRATEGYYMTPALLIGGRNDMRVNREEMFAPIACMIKIDDYEQGLAIANDTEFGLTAGICTNSLAMATHFRRHVETGCVMVNLPTAGTDYHVPFGGRKNSSFGSREQGRAAVEFFTQVKTSYIKSGMPL